MNKSELGLTIGLGMPQKPRVQKRRSKVKKRKLSNYDKQRRKLMQRINYWRKKGFELPDVDIPETEKQLREQGIKGQELAKRTRKLKEILKKKNFRKQRYVSRSSGEVFENRDQLNEAMGYSEEYIAYDAFAQRFENLLLRPINYGDGRDMNVVDHSRDCQKSLLYYFRQVVMEKGERRVGYEIATHGDECFEKLDAMMYGSEEIIQPSYDWLLQVFQIVTGKVLTQKEKEGLEEDANKYLTDFDY